MNFRVDLNGLADGMRISAEQLLAGLEKGVTDGALQIERVAKENLKGDPRGKHLMSSIHTQVTTSGMVVEAKVGCGAATDVEGDAGENFGIYVHEGTGIYSRTGMGRKEVPWLYMAPDQNTGEMRGHRTSGMQANPFLENAYNSEGQKVAQLIADAIMGG